MILHLGSPRLICTPNDSLDPKVYAGRRPVSGDDDVTKGFGRRHDILPFGRCPEAPFGVPGPLESRSDQRPGSQPRPWRL